MDHYFYVLVWALYPILHGYRDSKCSPIENRQWHWSGFILRTLVGAAMIQDFYMLFAYGAYFWVVFDLSYNIFKGHKWDYLGVTADSDKLFGKYEWVLKVLALLLGAYLVSIKL